MSSAYGSSTVVVRCTDESVSERSLCASVCHLCNITSPRLASVMSDKREDRTESVA